jgi:excisionase family DNA binding protein
MSQLLSVPEVAARLAISPWTVRAYLKNGKLRSVRIGRCVRVEEAEMEKFIVECRAPTSG